MPVGKDLVRRNRVTSTYRLQFNREFGFHRATELIPYLDRLGITHLYASPIFAASPGSSHGYDVIDPTRLNPELGTADEFDTLVETLHQHQMGLIIDIVPNHQATSALNPAWSSVLERGQQSPYARWFDIDWNRGGGKVMLPVLGRPLSEVLGAGEIKLDREGAEPGIQYYDHRLPLSPESRERFAAEIERDTPARQLLRPLLDMQHYQLLDWREAPRQLNYRRFFDINELVGVRVEDPEVFEVTHRLIFSLVDSGAIDGVRIDHVDGLADPTTYLQQLDDRLRAIAGARPIYVVVEKILARDEELNRSWPVAGTTGYDFLRVVNDVLVDVPGVDRLKRSFEVVTASSGGFDSIAYSAKRQIIEGLFTGDLDQLSLAIRELSEDVPGSTGISYSSIRDAVAEVTCHLDVYRTYGRDGTMPPDDRRRIDRATASAQDQLNLDPPALALVRSVLSLDLPESGRNDMLERCQAVVSRWQQLSGAVMAKSVEDTTFYRYVPLLSLNEVGSDPDVAMDPVASFHEWNKWAIKHWPHTMTTTSTHDTKRGEDARARLNVLSEIPAEWNEATSHWNRLNQRLTRQVGEERAPSLHDELFLYQTLLAAWPADARLTDELRARLHSYLTKAMREAKLQTNWIDPNQPYEDAVHQFLTSILDPNQSPDFIDEFGRFAKQVSPSGAVNAISQLLLKLTAVGVPDTYRGTEGWDLTLADPDNRRPVDFRPFERQLAALGAKHQRADDGAAVRDLLEHWEDGRIKLYLLERLLNFRREHPALFLDGDYLPLSAEGPLGAHLLAFARHLGDDWAITIVPRSLHQVTATNPTNARSADWLGTALVLPDDAPRAWHGILDGSSIQAVKGDSGPLLRLDTVFQHVPFAVLTAGDD